MEKQNTVDRRSI